MPIHMTAFTLLAQKRCVPVEHSPLYHPKSPPNSSASMVEVALLPRSAAWRIVRDGITMRPQLNLVSVLSEVSQCAQTASLDSLNEFVKAPEKSSPVLARLLVVGGPEAKVNTPVEELAELLF